VVVKGGGALERLARCTTLLLDKTGTVTTGRPEVVEVVVAPGVSSGTLVELAGSLEQASTHVLAEAIVRAAKDARRCLTLPVEVGEEPGRGVSGSVAGRAVRVGTASWAGVGADEPSWVRAARRRARFEGATAAFVAIDATPSGALIINDPVRSDASHAVRALRGQGIDRVVVVTGDRREAAEFVGVMVGIDDVVAECSPERKLEVVRDERSRAPTVMVGDGINDAPALALADVGVAMGVRGATASTEAADVVLTVDRLDRIGDARAIARRSRRIALQSVVAGMALSMAAMAVATTGHLPAVWGALLQEGIDVVVIVNALRALRGERGERVFAPAEEAMIEAFRAEHAGERAALERVREVADQLDELSASQRGQRVSELCALLEGTVVAHERAEEARLYPVLARAFGGLDPTGPMIRAHREVAARVTRLSHFVDGTSGAPVDAREVADLRRALYGLDAILQLHMSQEEENFFALGDRPADGSGPN
jgi:soluble P-type ATPase